MKWANILGIYRQLNFIFELTYLENTLFFKANERAEKLLDFSSLNQKPTEVCNNATK